VTNVTSDVIHILRIFYTCGIEVDHVTRGDDMTRGRNDRVRNDQGTKCPGRNDRGQNERGRIVG
jgi:hypothetical protein